MTRSDHFNGTHFVNPNGTAGQPFSALPKLFRTPRAPWPRRIDVTPQRPPLLNGASAAVTFVGHSTFLIQTPAGNVLTDPMFSTHAGPFGRLGPRRVREPAVRLADLPPIAVVLLSHNHYDHCDLPTLSALARRFDPLVVTALGNGRIVRSAGVRRVEELDWWQTTSASPIPVTATPAQHFSARTPFDKNRALWCGFSFMAGGRRIYFMGDTAYADYVREVPARVGAIDLALIPIGAYEPRWFMHVVHMNPAEAVQAHLDLRPARSIGMHFGTFQLTTEGIDEPVLGLEASRRERSVAPDAFATLPFGASVHLPR